MFTYLGRLSARLAGRPYTLLVLTMLIWGGNVVAGRLAVGEVSPMVVITLRWIIVCAVLFASPARARFIEDWPAVKRHWPFIAVMGAFGYTGFNALFYAAAHLTSGVNMAIVQGSMPIMVLLGAALWLRQPSSIRQMLGAAITLTGVAVIAGGGSLERLRALHVNAGDAMMLLATLFYAAYTVGLRRRPPMSPLGFFTAMACAALLTTLPLLGWEAATGALMWPTGKGWLAILFIALGPSLLGQLFYIDAVGMIGPGRAGVFVNLVPIFGALLSVLMLGEAFAAYHAVALALVLGGIAVAEGGSRRNSVTDV